MAISQGCYRVGELTGQGCLDQAQGCHKGSDLVTTLPPGCNKLGISICVYLSISFIWCLHPTST